MSILHPSQALHARRVHIIGIGGIGVSAIARYFLAQNAAVSGSDSVFFKNIELLINQGVSFTIGYAESHIPPDVDLVVYTIATLDDNPELIHARTMGVLVLTYPEMLGVLTRSYKTIAVSGTHGKTTTTAMTIHALQVLGTSPVGIVGSLMGDTGTNFIAGTGDYLVVEACEYRRSFMQLSPQHVIITNIDADHLDYYKDLDEIKHSFQAFASRIPTGGIVVAHPDVVLPGVPIAYTDDSRVDSITLPVPGAHNRRNALLVVRMLTALGFDETKVREALTTFPGTWRRLQYKGKLDGGAVWIDDYGHHPTEIRATMQALTERYKAEGYKIAVFFQPHLFSRTKEHFEEFAESFVGADSIGIAPIYAAREVDDGSVSSEMLVKAIVAHGGNAHTVYSPHQTKTEACALSEEWVVLTIGAGDIYTFLQ